jgi:hypothetical protein
MKTLERPKAIQSVREAIAYVKSSPWPDFEVARESGSAPSVLIRVVREIGHGMVLRALLDVKLYWEPPYNGGRDEPSSSGGWVVEEMEIVTRQLSLPGTPILVKLEPDQDGDDEIENAAQAWIEEQDDGFFDNEDDRPFLGDEA